MLPALNEAIRTYSFVRLSFRKYAMVNSLLKIPIVNQSVGFCGKYMYY